MSVLVVVLISLFTIAYARALLAVVGVLAIVLMLFGCVYVTDVLNGTLT